MILVALLAPVIALALLLCMPELEDWYQDTHDTNSDPPPH